MRLLIKNKFFSLRGHSTVTDETETPRFFVRGRFFSLRHRKTVEDMAGNKLYVVKNKIFNFLLPACIVRDAHGNKICKVKRRLRVFSSRFDVIGYRNAITIEGDMIARNMTILRDGQPIGRIQQHFLVLTDTFLLEAYNDDDAPFLVALIIAIDNIIDRQQNSNN